MRIQIEAEICDCTLHSLVTSEHSLVEVSSETQDEAHETPEVFFFFFLRRSIWEAVETLSVVCDVWFLLRWEHTSSGVSILPRRVFTSISVLTLTNNPDAQTRSSNARLSRERLLDDRQQKHPEVLREISSICRETRTASPSCGGARVIAEKCDCDFLIQAEINNAISNSSVLWLISDARLIAGLCNCTVS